MHSFLQRKLKNLHGEARVRGWSTPRPPPLIVQPKGGLPGEAGSHIHGARVPGAQRFARLRGRSRGPEWGWDWSAAGAGLGQGWEEEAPPGWGQPPGEREARPHPSGLGRDTLGLPPRRRRGCGRAGAHRLNGGRHRGFVPLPGASAWSGEGGIPEGPGTLSAPILRVGR